MVYRGIILDMMGVLGLEAELAMAGYSFPEEVAGRFLPFFLRKHLYCLLIVFSNTLQTQSIRLRYRTIVA
jgi:hypothetical protein